MATLLSGAAPAARTAQHGTAAAAVVAPAECTSTRCEAHVVPLAALGDARQAPRVASGGKPVGRVSNGEIRTKPRRRLRLCRRCGNFLVLSLASDPATRWARRLAPEHAVSPAAGHSLARGCCERNFLGGWGWKGWGCRRSALGVRRRRRRGSPRRPHAPAVGAGGVFWGSSFHHLEPHTARREAPGDEGTLRTCVCALRV